MVFHDTPCVPPDLKGLNEKKQKIIKKCKSIYKNVDKKIIKFDDMEIEEYEFHQSKSPISINDVDLKKVAVSNQLSFGKQDFKYFIGCKDSEKGRSLCIFHPQIIIYKRNFDKNRHLYFLIKKKSFSKHVEILEKVRNIIKNKFNSELIYSTKYINK